MSTEMREMTDEQIALEVQDGKGELFGMLVGRYEEKMIRYGRRFLGLSEDVYDVVQEAFLKAYININSFDVTKRFSPWMYRIAHNEFVNALRKKSRTVVFPLVDFDVLFPSFHAGDTVQESVRDEEVKRKLELCLDNLPAKYREPLVLYYIEELDYKDISEVLRIPVSTVGVRLRRGKEKLRAQCEKIK